MRKIIFIRIAILLLAVASLQATDYKRSMQAQQKLLRAYATLITNYADELDPMNLTDAAIDGMTGKLDPYTVLLKAQSKFRMDVLTHGEYGGVGIRIGSRNDSLTVISPMEDSPAWKAGILPGDKIIRIDSLYTIGHKLDDLAEMIRGPKGTEVQLTILRSNYDEALIFRLTRTNIEVREIPYAGFIEDGTGYIKLNGFSKHAAAQLRSYADSLQQKGMKRLILDLRNNTGGLLDQAVEILNLYLPKGQKVVQTRGLTRASNREFSLTEQPLLHSDVRIAILVNHGSASASEIVAGATQDLNRGIIVGQTTFGKGLVQNIFPLDDSSAVKITTSKYYIPSGRLIQKEDYFHDNEIISANPDLNHEYFTLSGRPLAENGGIVPDSTVDGHSVGPIVVDLWRRNMFADYVRITLLANPKMTGHEDPERYFDDFVSFLKQREYHFEHPLLKKVTELEKRFKDQVGENDFADLQPSFDALRAALSGNSESLLRESREEIIPFLRAEMLGFRGGQHDRIEGTLQDDDVLQTAVHLLKDDSYLKSLKIAPFNE